MEEDCTEKGKICYDKVYMNSMRLVAYGYMDAYVTSIATNLSVLLVLLIGFFGEDYMEVVKGETQIKIFSCNKFV